MNIKLYHPQMAREMTTLFHHSVHAIDTSMYTLRQKEAWAPTPPDYPYWYKRLAEKKPFVAIIGDVAVGFIEFEPDGYINCLYTHPKHQRKGVATALYRYVLKIAKARKIRRLYTNASLVAKPFFENNGFSMIEKNLIEKNGEVLINFTMEKHM